MLGELAGAFAILIGLELVELTSLEQGVFGTISMIPSPSMSSSCSLDISCLGNMCSAQVLEGSPLGFSAI